MVLPVVAVGGCVLGGVLGGVVVGGVSEGDCGSTLLMHQGKTKQTLKKKAKVPPQQQSNHSVCQGINGAALTLLE